MNKYIITVVVEATDDVRARLGVIGALKEAEDKTLSVKEVTFPFEIK